METSLSSNAIDSVILQIPLPQIRMANHQVRQDFNEEGIQTLADSIAKEGLIQPVTVRKVQAEPALYELIAGERRFRAVTRLKLPTIKAIIIDVPSEAAAAAKGLVENIQRQDLNPIEEADGFSWLNKLDPDHWDQGEIAKICGKDRTYVNKSISLLQLPAEILASVRRRTLSRGHAIDLLRLQGHPQQLQVAQEAENGLSVKETRRLIDTVLAGTPQKEAKSTPAAVDPFTGYWSEFKKRSDLSKFGDWKVDYKSEKWQFELSPLNAAPLKNMADWFQTMADALQAVWLINDPASTLEADVREGEAKIAALREKAVQATADLMTPPHLPQTDQERSELEALAVQGPLPFYIALYGADHPMTLRMANASWADFGVSDPVQMCRDFLATQTMKP